MDYYDLRILIFFIVLIIATFVLIKYKIYKMINKKVKNSFVTIIILISIFTIIYDIIWIFPYEGTILKFSNVDNIINHFIEKDKIIKKYKYDDYAYVLYESSADLIPKFLSFSKNKKGNWKVNSMPYITKERFVTAYDNRIWITRIPSKNSIAIEIYHSYLLNGEEYKISDSLDSKFDTFFDERPKYKNIENKYNNLINVVILDEKVDQDYTLYLNGKEYKPFK